MKARIADAGTKYFAISFSSLAASALAAFQMVLHSCLNRRFLI
jgi:hypothetical protein